MRARAGVLLDEGGVIVAVVTGGGAVTCLPLEAGENLGALIAGELDGRGYKRRRLRVGLDRRLAVVKVLELPRAQAGDMGQMVRFELERHVPFPPEDVACDWSGSPARQDGPLRVLVGACESRRVEQALHLVREAGRRPLALSIACHDLRALLPRRIQAKRAVWAHRHDGRTDLVFIGHAVVRLSRSIPAETPHELVREIQRSLALLQWRDCEALWVSGDESERFLSAPALAELGAPVSEPPFGEQGRALVESLPEERHGAAMLALAVACGSRQPRINLLPAALRPRRISRGQLVTAAMAGLTLLLGLGLLGAQVWQRQRYVGQISQELRHLDPEAKSVERLAADVNQKKRLMAALRGVEARGLHVLPFLRDLTELVPQDAWIQSLSLDGQGVELIGQAATASALIPTLEASPWLERVEFTSPVTKGQGKEQFRLRANWERPPHPALSPAGGDNSRPRVPSGKGSG
jgi:Tfp pilus assembly protein PilN